MADGASFDLDGRVFEHERTVLLGVTCRAGFPRGRIQERTVLGSVHAVAVGALHRSFGHPVMEGL